VKREKLLDKIRQNTKNVSFGDLQTLLENYGFALKRVRGSHHVFSGLIGDQRVRLVVPFHRPFVKEAYVKEALDLIDSINRLKEAGTNADSENA